MTAPAVADDKVYEGSEGQWTIRGFVVNEYDRFCLVSSYWDDGSRVNINIFPKEDGSIYSTLTVKNVEWNLNHLDKNTDYTEDFVFKYSHRPDERLPSYARVNDNNTFIFRHL